MHPPYRVDRDRRRVVRIQRRRTAAAVRNAYGVTGVPFFVARFPYFNFSAVVSMSRLNATDCDLLNGFF